VIDGTESGFQVRVSLEVLGSHGVPVGDGLEHVTDVLALDGEMEGLGARVGRLGITTGRTAERSTRVVEFLR